MSYFNNLEYFYKKDPGFDPDDPFAIKHHYKKTKKYLTNKYRNLAGKLTPDKELIRKARLSREKYERSLSHLDITYEERDKKLEMYDKKRGITKKKGQKRDYNINLLRENDDRKRKGLPPKYL